MLCYIASHFIRQIISNTPNSTDITNMVAKSSQWLLLAGMKPSSGFVFRKLKCQKEQSRKQHLLLLGKFKVNPTLERWLTGVG